MLAWSYERLANERQVALWSCQDWHSNTWEITTAEDDILEMLQMSGCINTITGNWRCKDPWRVVLFQPMYLLSPPPPLPFPRSWDQFHDCANMAMAGCPDEAAAVWESLRQESKKMQFSGNLYDMCSNRNNHPVASVSPRGSSNQEEINQESLRGRADHLAGCLHLLMLLSPLLLLLFWI